MAPKKLTDCPENLRESIDWLIQVRHGGDGRGLGELAKALERLIEEAIADAFTSNVDPLLNVINPACGKSDNCMSTFEKIEKLKQQVITAEKVEKDQFKILLQLIEQHSKEYKKYHYADSSREKALEGVKSKLSAIDKLRENLETFTKNPNDILTNLCDGLETFLGFNKDSKGYTGTGIVYSDLDRLCDGVMSFILNCLEVNKYLLIQYKPDICDTISSLRDSIGKVSGVEGFGDAIDNVKTGLEGYEDELAKRTRKLVIPCQTLLNLNIKDLEIMHSKRKKDPVEIQINEWTAATKYFPTKIQKSQDALRTLDDDLQKKLEMPMKLIDQAVNTFMDASKIRDIQGLVASSATEFSKLMEYVEYAMALRRRTLYGYLNTEIGNLDAKVKKLKSDQFGDLVISVNRHLLPSLRKTESLITELEKKFNSKIVGELESIRKDASALYTKVQDEKQALRNQVNELGRQIEALGRAKAGISKKLPAELDDFKKDRWNINEQIEPLYTAVSNNVKGYIGDLAIALKNAVSAAVGPSGETPGLHAMERGELWNLKKLAAWIESAKADKTGLGADLERFLSNLKDAETKWTSNSSKRSQIYEEVVESIKNAFSDKATGGKFNPNLYDLLTAAALKGITEIQVEVDQILNTELNKIKEALEKLQTKDAKAHSLVASTLQIEAEALNLRISTFLSTDVGDKADVHGSFYKDLKNLQNNINEIGTKAADAQKKVNKVADEFDACIQNAQRLLEEAPTRITSVMNALQKELRAKIEEGLQNIQTKAQWLYADRKQKELLVLKEILESQTRRIEKIITEDKRTGIKGLLIALGGFSVNAPNNPNKLTALKHKTNVPELSSAVKRYLDSIVTYAWNDIENVVESRTTDLYVFCVEKIRNGLYNLFNHLKENVNRTYNFDQKFVDLLKKFKKVLAELIPVGFGVVSCPILDALTGGMNKLTEELDKAYINRYAGTKEITWQNTRGLGSKAKLTVDGRNCAKVCLSILETLSEDFYNLTKECDANQNKQINTYKDDVFGNWFNRRGYTVTSEPGKQLGELQDKAKMTGRYIQSELITNQSMDVSNITILQEWITMKNKNAVSSGIRHKSNTRITLVDLLHFLRLSLHDYYKVSHYRITANPKAPLNAYQMLQWLSGLWYSPMQRPVFMCIKELFPKPNEHKNDPDHSKIPADLLKFSATTEITYQELAAKIMLNVCLQSQDTLVAILGNGHAGGRYACEFYTNEDNLDYPNNPSACFDMFVDILNRVYPQFRFLYSQCSNDSRSGGWLDCVYGRYVGGSSWTCNDKQCFNQKGDQTCGQTCEQHPKCGVKSPLQSFLEDGLQGFLPHQLIKVGCGVKCSVGNHFGKPCLAPMGFSDIAVAASHTKKASHLRHALYNFCSSDSDLSKMCSQLNCLLRRAPMSLGEMFAFYYNFLANWNTSMKHRKTAFESAVKEANFFNDQTTLDITSMFGSSTHSNHTYNDDRKHLTGDLLSLMKCKGNPSTSPALPCGPFLEPITAEIFVTFSEKRAVNYLSWVVYITETFFGLLSVLYESCKKCDTPGTRCAEKSCVDRCEVKYSGKDEKSKSPSTYDKHTEDCHSIVNCPDMHPTLYKYGLTFNSPYDLSGVKDVKTRRTCKDLCKALEKIVGEECVLVRILHAIDDFLCLIRWPFMLTTVALWLLSLLYLLHIMVIRLDLLHIKSHLHSPSSHRIAAQSLLAAARVGKLAKITYLQP